MANKNESQFENIKKLGSVLKDDKLPDLMKKIKGSQYELGDILRKLDDKTKELDSIAKMEKENLKNQAEGVEPAVEVEKVQVENVQVENVQVEEKKTTKTKKTTAKVKEDKESLVEKTVKTEEVAPSVKEESKTETVLEVKTKKATVKTKEMPPLENVSQENTSKEKTVAPTKETKEVKEVKETKEEPKAESAEQAPKANSFVKYNIFEQKQEKKQYVIRDNRPKTEERKPYNGERREYVPRDGQRPPYNRDGQRPPYNRDGQRPPYNKDGQRPPYNKDGQRPPYNKDGQRPPYNKDGQRPPYNKDGQRPPFNKDGKKPFTQKESLPDYIAPQPQKTFGNKKKTNDKSFEEKKTISKRVLIKSQISVDDFDENKTGYRKVRVKKAKTAQVSQVIKIEKAVLTTELVPLKVLSEKLGISAIEITKRLFKEGILKTINDVIDFDTASFIASDLGIELELKLDKTAEDSLKEAFGADDEADDNMIARSPVVTVMGHVDHGKTSLLDRIRKTNVQTGEAGGITQHIGAYQVSLQGKQITFLDTPGHAAFTSMRLRGAMATDIAVIVVAADDGIMPQTVEAINHAKAAKVEIIVAVNKIDRPESDIERVKSQLTEHGLVPEEWGGNVMFVPVSAKTGEGIENLLEAINIMSEVMELKANPNRKAKGVVVEAKLDTAKGPLATVLIQNGTLKVSDSIVIGTVVGKVRAMIDDKGRKVKEAGPSMPVSIMGLSEVPNAGDTMFAVEKEKLTKQIVEERKNKEKEDRIKQAQKVTLDDVFSKIAEGQLKVLNILIKADVQGSSEAVKQSLEKIRNEEVRVNIVHSGVGAISESDIMLAESSNAIIIGFNVRPDSKAKNVAEKSGVDIKLYRVIYEAIDDVEKALKGMLAPKFQEIYMGKAEVRNTFRITGVGMVAGCYVTEGKIVRNGKLRIYRDDVMITEGNVLQLKRFKDDVKEVSQGFECGISIEKFNDIKNDDFIECYLVEQINA